VWIGFIWLRTQTRGGLLWTRHWTFGIHKINTRVFRRCSVRISASTWVITRH
jgi:hypothetical protein